MNLADRDPYNLIITGVGGQGNVLAARLLGEMLLREGLFMSIGEIFGASQRGGSVMSHVRISTESSPSPRIPGGLAHLILSLEPIETLRVLKEFGNPGIVVISNTRPVHPIGVISGEHGYPSMEAIREQVEGLAELSWFVPAGEKALELGNPILANIVLIGALAGTDLLPLKRQSLEKVLSSKMNQGKVQANLQAFQAGLDLMNKVHGSGFTICRRIN